MDDLSSLLGASPNQGGNETSWNETGHEERTWKTNLSVAETYHEQMPSTWTPAYWQGRTPPTAPRVALAVSTDLKQWNYRYMFEKKGERSLELDTRLGEMGDVIQQAFGLSKDWDDPTIPSQESVYTVGRICARLDPPSMRGKSSVDADGPSSLKLTMSNLMLETSRMVGNGQRVPLVIDAKCRIHYAWTDATAQASNVLGLFPGMIVGMKGRNGSGHRFVAEELFIVRRHSYLSEPTYASHLHFRIQRHNVVNF